ncbi:MAG: DUF488 domain-containing protein [Candidatus Cloacimonetes bacterium]|nr:DUF488 domain-containing protein [Candidatus Cloacimonadota bacterium]
MQNKMIYTIGHSNHPVELFINMLKDRGINLIIDIRSMPYSRYAGDYNKTPLKAILELDDIDYIFMGDLLGGRYTDPSLLFYDGKVDFGKVSQTDSFKKGINRIIDFVQKRHTVALMCSEKNPLECHRFAMIAPTLMEKGYEVLHILPEMLIGHKTLEDKLFEYYRTIGNISLDIEKISGIDEVQSNFLNLETKADMYLALNKLIGYDTLAKERK